ncbi:MAG: hypothetical protein ABIZ80_24345 [Bryobacteraceae bacterium]
MRKLLLALIGAALFISGTIPLPAQGVRASLDARERGFENGYRDGFLFGQTPRVSNREQDMVNQRLREFDKDYQAAFGPKEQYRQGYADGFREGMEDSRAGRSSRQNDLFRRDSSPIRRDDRIEPIPPLRNREEPSYRGAALDAVNHGFEHGYRDGFGFGQNTQVSNREQDIVNQRLREADKDYQLAFGPREQFRRGYADGFQEGMEDGRTGKRSRQENLFGWDAEFDPVRDHEDRMEAIYLHTQWPALHVADDMGYRDGFNLGMLDRRNGRRFQSRPPRAWEQEVYGFDVKSASKEQYRNTYRGAYKLGYRDGFGGPR